MNIPGQLCLKTYSLKTITELVPLAQAVRSCNLDAVDISGVHVNYKDPGCFAGVVATLSGQGVRIVGNGVVVLGPDAAHINRVFAFAQIAGSRVVSVHLQAEGHRDTIKMLEAVAEYYDMRIAIHNHGGAHWHGSSEALRYLLSLGGPRLGLCIDSGWALDASEDPVAWVKEFGSRVHAAHLKDFTFDRKGAETDMVLGQGVLDLPGFIGSLTAVGFSGPLAIEYEAHDPDVTPAIRACVAALRA